ncbi:TPA: GNAT family N-acetyltransferase [Vibrio parahaemolyticus]|nr:GNAT family N-acetyltransferase [Vibrio parahaemolyticus]
MDIYPEIDLSREQHAAIESLRNKSFPEDQVARSYYKQLPHMRALKYLGDKIVGYMGLDYRVVSVGNENFKVLGVIDFCVDSEYQGEGIGSSMLSHLADYAFTKDVDFIILISDLHAFYSSNGYQRVDMLSSWLRLSEHKNYGVAVEYVDDLYVKSISGKSWTDGHMDWLGYMY